VRKGWVRGIASRPSALVPSALVRKWADSAVGSTPRCARGRGRNAAEQTGKQGWASEGWRLRERGGCVGLGEMVRRAREGGRVSEERMGEGHCLPAPQWAGCPLMQRTEMGPLLLLPPTSPLPPAS
jgi:hypothetical protein